jgi:hypothetical protein
VELEAHCYLQVPIVTMHTSIVNKNSTAPAAAASWISTPAGTEMRCCRMHA